MSAMTFRKENKALKLRRRAKREPKHVTSEELLRCFDQNPKKSVAGQLIAGDASTEKARSDCTEAAMLLADKHPESVIPAVPELVKNIETEFPSDDLVTWVALSKLSASRSEAITPYLPAILARLRELEKVGQGGIMKNLLSMDDILSPYFASDSADHVCTLLANIDTKSSQDALKEFTNSNHVELRAAARSHL